MFKIIIICLFPIIVLFTQILSPLIVIVMGIVFLFGAIIFPNFRKIFLLFCFWIIGYLFWAYIVVYVSDITSFSFGQKKILSRLGLLSYVLFFSIWYKLQKPRNTFFKIGNGKEIIHFPFIWKGFKEIEWRFTLIFSLLWFCVAIIFAIKNGLEYNILIYGVIFSVINAIIEEIIWRGFVLTRLIDLTSEKIALIVSSLSFGLYHYSLNFPLLICFTFAIGGFYIGGSAIKSKGLLSPIIMHITVNLAFVSMGIIN